MLPAEQQDLWQELCAEHHFTLPHHITTGGATRFDSVRSGLSKLPAEGLVAVHDGVRPLVSRTLIRRTFEVAEETGAALPACPVTDSLRFLGEETRTRRSIEPATVRYRPPQTFDLERLHRAYEQPFSPQFTDDASVYEAAGLGAITLVEGEETNIKLTTPRDLLLADLLLD